MKRVTFRVPEDHDIPVSAEILKLAVIAEYPSIGGAITHVHRHTDGWTFDGSIRVFASLDEAQTAAGEWVRGNVRQQVFADKVSGIR